jgi:hypothetical protein
MRMYGDRIVPPDPKVATPDAESNVLGSDPAYRVHSDRGGAMFSSTPSASFNGHKQLDGYLLGATPGHGTPT